MAALGVLAGLSACGDESVGNGVFGDGGGDASAGIDSVGDGDGDGDGSDAGDGDGDGSDAGDAGDGDGDGAPKFDVPSGDGDGDGDDGGFAESCTGVDLFFVIDNSGSMGKYQNALGIAFPQFVDTLVSSLPPSTSLHVGVTSTEMGYASSGSSSVNNGTCMFSDGMGGTEVDYYITPDVMNTGTNGAQGRLYRPNGTGEPWVDFETDDGSGVAAAKSWFTQAAAIGTGGSNIEMLTAPAGWAAHPVNTGAGAPNEGFFRDDGVVTVVFFMQDEPDQTPVTVGGNEAGAEMLQMLAAAKPICGGTKCIIAGGFLRANACGALPIDNFLNGVGGTANVATLPGAGLGSNLTDQQIADEMNAHLSTVLADVIAQKCDEIPPAG